MAKETPSGPEEAETEPEVDLWVSRMLALFPVPRPGLQRPLFEALLRIARATPWLEASLGYRATDRLTKALETLPLEESDFRMAAQISLVGEYDLAGTIVGSEAAPMPGPEQLRAALWVCAEQWALAGDRKSGSVKAVASAIRNAVKVRTKTNTDTHAIARHLPAIQGATSLKAFIEATNVFLVSEQESIRGPWADVERQLLGVLDKQSKPDPQIKPPPGGKPALDGYDEDQEIEELIAGVRPIASPPLPGTTNLQPGEPLSEETTTTFVAPVTGSVSNPDARTMAKYKAKQVVWNQNVLLLTNHPDVLQAGLLRRILAVLVSELHAAEDMDSRMGLVGLLLQAVTGRTTKSLLAMNVVDRFDCAQVSPFELCLAEAAIRIRVFFARNSDSPNGYFNPTKEQAPYLEAVDDSFLLPLPSVVVNALRQNGALNLLPKRGEKKSEKKLDAAIRNAARHVSSLLETSITMGQVRRSFPAHLFELCRDTALTQLICADTLGQSDAPAHYFAPRAEQVADTYRTLLNILFGDEASCGAAVPDTRVGARLLVRPEAAREMTASIGAILHAGVERLISTGQICAVHHAMTSQLGCMFMAACTHRPTNALFDLLIIDFYLVRGAALFRDKIHDPAHDPRLVALPSCVIRQIHAYLAHLRGLAAVLPNLSALVDKILAGKAPLLFGLDSDGNHESLTIGAFTDMLPLEWRVVPLNWGRTWMRTRSIEHGLRPELASIQMGHLEAVGYPFSNASPTEPAQFVSAIRPVLDRLAEDQGWTVRRGIGGHEVPSLPGVPLRAWASKVKLHEQAARDMAKDWRDAQKARMKSYRRQAEKYVLEHPAVITMGIDVLYANKTGPWQKHALTREGAELLRDVMFEDAGTDIAMGLARSEALNRILKWVNKKVEMQGEEPAKLITLRRPVDNAFVPDMMLAVRQVRDLRQAVLDRSIDRPGSWRDFALACARTAQTLALYGFCDSPNQIEGVLTHRNSVVRSAALNDAILVKWGPEPEQVVGLRGLAALSVAKLAKKYPEQAVPAREEINTALETLLPEWAVPNTKVDLLALLCETVSVSNRFELSPAARMALDARKGSVCAHWREQIALLDADPLHSFSRHWEQSQGKTADDRIHVSANKRTGNSRTQYLALCRTIPLSGKDLHLPLTQQSIAAADLNQPDTRSKVTAEIQMQIDQTAPDKVLQPVVRLLAGWVLDMLVKGTEARKNPANETIITYLTRIGGILVEILGNSSLIDLDDAELEDVYLAVVESKHESGKAAAAVISFHDCCMRNSGFPELDLSEVRAYLGSDARSVDAMLVLPVEREAAVHRLHERAIQSESTGEMVREEVRVERQASAAMPMYGYAGARRSEVLGAKNQDVNLVDEETSYVRIRANRSRRLKTRAARRCIELSGVVPKEAIGQFTRWFSADKSRLLKWRHESSYVFSPLEDGRRADGRSAIASACADALAEATGRQSEKIHRLRHLVAFERITPLFLSESDLAALSHLMGDTSPSPGEVVLPRDLAGQVTTLGHARWSTTLRCYYHFPWLLRSRADAEISEQYFSRRGAAAVMGLTLPAADRITQKSKQFPAEQAWLNSAISPRLVPEARDQEAHVQISQKEHGTATSWSALELGRLLGVVERTGSLHSALDVMGGATGEADHLRGEFLAFEKRLGRRIVGGEWIDLVDMPKRVVRDLAQASNFECWWTTHDSGSEEQRERLNRVTDQIFEYMSSTDGDSITIKSAAVSELSELLKGSGILESDIEICELALDLRSVRVARRRPAVSEDTTGDDQVAEAPAARYLGLVIKRAFGVVWVANRLHADGL